MKSKIKKGDRVIVISGKEKGKTGEVIRVIPDESRVVIEGVNIRVRHQKQTQSKGQTVPAGKFEFELYSKDFNDTVQITDGRFFMNK